MTILPNVFGPAVGRGAVRAWILAGLRVWLPDYLRNAERIEGYPVGQAILPRSLTVANDVTKWPETMLPALIVQLPGMSDNGATRQGDGSLAAEWIVALSFIARGRDEADTQRLGDVYGLALRMLMIQQAGDFAHAGEAYTGPDLTIGAVDLADEAYDDLPQLRGRTLVAATVTFRVEIRDFASTAYGPDEPSADPTIDPGPWPEVTDTDLQITRRPLT